jgi:cell division protein FtsQ
LRKIRELFGSLTDFVPETGISWSDLSGRVRVFFAQRPEASPDTITHAPMPSPLALFLKRRRRPTGFNRQLASGQLSMAPAVLACLAFYGLVGVYGYSVIGQRFAGDPDVTGSVPGMAPFTGLEVKNIEISGLSNEFRRGEIIAALGVDYDDSILWLNMTTARDRVRQLPWIDQAEVRRLLPGTLSISIVERTPFAIWQNDGKITVIDAAGLVISELVEDADLSMPQVVGPGANFGAREILAAIESRPTIRSRMRALVRVADRRWNIRLRNGMDIRLPEEGVESALDQLVALDTIHGLLDREIAAIDLRLRDRISIRLTNEADGEQPLGSRGTS